MSSVTDRSRWLRHLSLNHQEFGHDTGPAWLSGAPLTGGATSDGSRPVEKSRPVLAHGRLTTAPRSSGIRPGQERRPPSLRRRARSSVLRLHVARSTRPSGAQWDQGVGVNTLRMLEGLRAARAVTAAAPLSDSTGTEPCSSPLSTAACGRSPHLRHLTLRAHARHASITARPQRVLEHVPSRAGCAGAATNTNQPRVRGRRTP
jgi:hypothetical protein